MNYTTNKTNSYISQNDNESYSEAQNLIQKPQNKITKARKKGSQNQIIVSILIIY